MTLESELCDLLAEETSTLASDDAPNLARVLTGNLSPKYKAASDLLAALKGLTQWVQDNFEGMDSGPVPEDWEPVYQAIEKAEGKA